MLSDMVWGKKKKNDEKNEEKKEENTREKQGVRQEDHRVTFGMIDREVLVNPFYEQKEHRCTSQFGGLRNTRSQPKM